jgi:hypothetical protein
VRRQRRPPRPTTPTGLVEEATDIIATIGGLTHDRARAVLQMMSAQTRIKEWHVAQLLVDWAVSGRLPADLHRELRNGLDHGGLPDNAPAKR